MSLIFLYFRFPSSCLVFRWQTNLSFPSCLLFLFISFPHSSHSASVLIIPHFDKYSADVSSFNEMRLKKVRSFIAGRVFQDGMQLSSARTEIRTFYCHARRIKIHSFNWTLTCIVLVCQCLYDNSDNLLHNKFKSILKSFLFLPLFLRLVE